MDKINSTHAREEKCILAVMGKLDWKESKGPRHR
jgi:hypothetical protein